MSQCPLSTVPRGCLHAHHGVPAAPLSTHRTAVRAAAKGGGRDQKNAGVYFEYTRVDPKAEKLLPEQQKAANDEFAWASTARSTSKKEKEEQWRLDGEYATPARAPTRPKPAFAPRRPPAPAGSKPAGQVAAKAAAKPMPAAGAAPTGSAARAASRPAQAAAPGASAATGDGGSAAAAAAAAVAAAAAAAAAATAAAAAAANKAQQQMSARKDKLQQRLQGGPGPAAASPASSPPRAPAPPPHRHPAAAAAAATMPAAASTSAPAAPRHPQPTPEERTQRGVDATSSGGGGGVVDAAAGAAAMGDALLLAEFGREQAERTALASWAALAQKEVLGAAADGGAAAGAEAAAGVPRPAVSAAEVASGRLLEAEDVAGALGGGDDDDFEDMVLGYEEDDAGEADEVDMDLAAADLDSLFAQIDSSKSLAAANSSELASDWKDVQRLLAELRRPNATNAEAAGGDGGVSESQALDTLRAQDPDLFKMLDEMEDGDLFAELMAEGGGDGDDDDEELSAEELALMQQMTDDAMAAAGAGEEEDADDDGDDSEGALGDDDDEDLAGAGELGMSSLFDAIEDDPLLDEEAKQRAAWELQSMFNQPAQALEAPAGGRKGARGAAAAATVRAVPDEQVLAAAAAAARGPTTTGTRGGGAMPLGLGDDLEEPVVPLLARPRRS